MDRERSRLPVPRPNGQTNGDGEHEMKRNLLLLTLATVVAAGLEVVEKTLESRGLGGKPGASKMLSPAAVSQSSASSQVCEPGASVPTQEYQTQDHNVAMPFERSQDDTMPVQPDSPKTPIRTHEDLSKVFVPAVKDAREEAKLAWYGFHFHDGDDACGSPGYHEQKALWQRRFDELGIFQTSGPSPLAKSKQEEEVVQIDDGV